LRATELAKAVAASWARPQRDNFIPVFDLARTLGDSAAYPREWVAYLLANLHNEDAARHGTSCRRRLHGDWHVVLDAANDLITRQSHRIRLILAQGEGPCRTGHARRRHHAAPMFI